VTVAAVADTGPLIHLAEIDSLELLSAFDRLYIPETVHAELEAGGVPLALSEVEYELVELSERRSHFPELDAGETSALTVAIEQGADLLTDDLDAREVAMEDGVEVHGSVGVIALGYARGLLERDEAAARMRALQRETSLFVTDGVIERGIRMLEGT